MPGSFAFRVACYEEFHWGPEQIDGLPYSEALLLAVYFEELARRRRKDAPRPHPSGMQAAGPHERVITEDEVDEDD